MGELREDAVLANRVHNIIHGTGHGVQLAPADTLRYNNIASMDAFINFGETLDVRSDEQVGVMGLHTDMSTGLSHPDFTGPAEKVMYFDDTPLEKDNDAEVAMRTSVFDSMQRGQAVIHYGRSNEYDVRGFSGLQEAQEAQRAQFKANQGPQELRNRVNPDIVNDTTPRFRAPQLRAPLDTDALPARNMGEDDNAPEAPSYYPTEPMSGDTPSWYEPLEANYVASAKRPMIGDYVTKVQSQ